MLTKFIRAGLLFECTVPAASGASSDALVISSASYRLINGDELQRSLESLMLEQPVVIGLERLTGAKTWVISL